MGWGHLKIFFSRTTGPILTRLITNHSREKGIQVFFLSIKGPGPFQRGAIHKKWDGSLEPLGQFLPALSLIILGGWGFKFVQLKWEVLLQEEIIAKE
jgi:hypothetical protein